MSMHPTMFLSSLAIALISIGGPAQAGGSGPAVGSATGIIIIIVVAVVAFLCGKFMAKKTGP